VPCRTHPRPRAGVHCLIPRPTRSSLQRHRGSSRPQLTGLVSRRARARGRSRPPRRTSPATRPAGGTGPMPPPSRTASSRPARARVPCLVSRPASGRGLPRTRCRTRPRPGSDRGPTRRACSAVRCPVSSRAVPSDGPHQAKCLRALRRAGSSLAMPRRPTASRAHRHPTSPPTACPGRRLPATRGGCLPATRLPRTASRGAPRPVVRLRQVLQAAGSADRRPTPAEHRRAGCCRATHRRPTASRAHRLLTSPRTACPARRPPVRSRSRTA
jgi:hypothetical protein